MQRLGALGAIIALIASNASAQSSIVIELHDTANTDDDYLCWSPVQARARLVQPVQGEAVEVTVTAERDAAEGNLAFATWTADRPTLATWTAQDSLQLELPADGSWAPFWVAGTAASTADKDVAIAIGNGAGDLTGSLPVMVRVRKNADSLTESEQRILTDALARLHGHDGPNGPTGEYEKYATAHGKAFYSGIHGGNAGNPLFLVWHRAFLLSLERELQAIDARVALPYWRFDRASTTIFTPEFMGRVETSNLVSFAEDNKLTGWRMQAGQGLARARNGDGPANVSTLATLFGQLGIGSYQPQVPGDGANAKVELRYHNMAHNAIQGWLGSGTSPRDPVFYLLHANVDRAFAEWQVRFDRFNPAALESYPLPGNYPGVVVPLPAPKGSYLLDTMWPWSGENGSQTPDDPRDDWPAGWFDFPGGHGAATAVAPRPIDMIDYQDRRGTGGQHGACYDDLPFAPGAP